MAATALGGFSDKYLPSCNLPPLKDVHAVYINVYIYIYTCAHKHAYLS